jgi:hypothetical protein
MPSSPRRRSALTGYYFGVLTTPRVRAILGPMQTGETKQKFDWLWIGSLILVTISVLGLAYVYWAGR